MAIQIDETQCIGCGSCVASCPLGALDFTDLDGHVNVDVDACITCLACAGACPVNAIEEESY